MLQYPLVHMVIEWVSSDTICSNPGPHPKWLAESYYLGSLILYKYPRPTQNNRCGTKYTPAWVLTLMQGVLHWVARPSPGVDPLKVENPAELEDWLADLNPHSKEVIPEAYAVPSLAGAVLGDKFQFERLGYFAVDPDTAPGKLVFNRTVTLRDSYSKVGSK